FMFYFLPRMSLPKSVPTHLSAYGKCFSGALTGGNTFTEATLLLIRAQKPSPMHTHTHMHAYAHAHTHKHTHIHTPTHTHTHTHTHKPSHTHTPSLTRDGVHLVEDDEAPLLALHPLHDPLGLPGAVRGAAQQ